MQMNVPAQVYDFPEEDIQGVTKQLHSLLSGRRFLSNGEFVSKFEDAFAGHHGALLATATSSGTAALEAILTSLDVAGGEVIMPANTFAATAFAVVRAGARPVFADIRNDLSLDPHDAEQRITTDTKAIITVHIGGLISPATLDLVELSRNHRVPLVEDAAQAHGSTLYGRTAGTFGIAAAFSFFSTKVITTGEGGMVLTRDEGLHHTVGLLRDQGKSGGRNYHEVVGANWRMTELQAMLGLAQVARLPQFIDRRRQLAERYRQGLASVPGIEVLPVPDGAAPNYYKLVALLDAPTSEPLLSDPPSPDLLQRQLKEQYQISLSGYVFELPLHQQPVFSHLANGPLPMAEQLCRRHFCPPIYPSLTDAQVDHVVSAVREQMDVLVPDPTGGR